MATSDSREHVASLERGLRVLQTFSRERPQLTLSQVAVLAGLSPATARRSLHTLERLGYIGRSGRQFLLRPRVLAIGAGYLSAINAEVVLQPFLEQVVSEVGGSASVTVLDDLEIVYLAHAASRSIRLNAGARYPAYATSMGRVMLAFQPKPLTDAYFQRATLRRITEFTETDPQVLNRLLETVRQAGYAVVQDEIDYGLVSVAIPVLGPSGTVIAAASCTDVTNRATRETLVELRLPALRLAVRRIEGTLARHPQLAHSVESSTRTAP